MNMKTWVMIGMGVGSTLGALVPMLLGSSDLMGGWSILGGTVGGLLGIWLGYKIGKALS